jgi:hypothetical protein
VTDKPRGALNWLVGDTAPEIHGRGPLPQIPGVLRMQRDTILSVAFLDWRRAIRSLFDQPRVISMLPRRALPFGLSGTAHFGEFKYGAS